MRSRSPLALFSVLLVGACDGTSGEAPQVALPVPATVSSSVPEPVPTSTPDAGAAPTSLPAIEDTCTVDDDCTVIAFETSGEHTCCPSCNTTPVTKAWAKEARATCEGTTPERCLPLSCPQGPMVPRCDSGRCVALP